MTEHTDDIERAAIEAVDESAGLIVYCRAWCPDCRRAIEWLDDRGIEYTVVDVDSDHRARDQAEALNDGDLHTPTFAMGDGVCVDFRPEQLKELLGMD